MFLFSRIEFSLSGKNLILYGIHSAVWWMWQNLTHSFSDSLSLCCTLSLSISCCFRTFFLLCLCASCILLLYLCFTPTLCWGTKHNESRDERWRKWSLLCCHFSVSIYLSRYLDTWLFHCFSLLPSYQSIQIHCLVISASCVKEATNIEHTHCTMKCQVDWYANWLIKNPIEPLTAPEAQCYLTASSG